MRALVVSVVLVACGGGGRAKPPVFHTDVAQVLAVPPNNEDVASPEALAASPWQVGQWALYKMTSKGNTGYMKYSVVGQDACGIWFEQVIADATHRLVVKLCLPSPPDLSKVAQAIVQVDANAPAVMAKPPQDLTLVGADWPRATDAPREDVAVAAGRFHGTVKLVTQVKGDETTVWAHPAVPLAGTVRTESKGGLVTELIGYGASGATSAIGTR